MSTRSRRSPAVSGAQHPDPRARLAWTRAGAHGRGALGGAARPMGRGRAQPGECPFELTLTSTSMPIRSEGSPVQVPVKRHRLARIAHDSDADQVAIADDAVGRVEFHPAGAGQIDFAARHGWRRRRPGGRRSPAHTDSPRRSAPRAPASAPPPSSATAKSRQLPLPIRNVLTGSCVPGSSRRRYTNCCADRVGHRRQQLHRAGRSVMAQELPRPAVDDAARDRDIGARSTATDRAFHRRRR